MSNEPTKHGTNTSNGNGHKPIALEALRRAAEQARQLARQTHTPVWIMSNGKLIDAMQSEAAETTP